MLKMLKIFFLNIHILKALIMWTFMKLFLW